MSSDLIYGIRNVLEALEEDVSLHKVFIQKDLHTPRMKDIITRLKESRIPFQLVPKEKLNRLTQGNHQGVVAMGAAVRYRELDEVLEEIFAAGEVPLIVVLDEITDIRNLGAIARSAECFGAHAILMPAQGSAPINADAMKSSAGALHKISVCRALNFREAIEYLLGSGLTLVAATEKAKKEIAEADLKVPLGLVMGSEGEGINPKLLAQCHEQVRIPMTGTIGSLNVSVAAGIMLYEALRQRRAL